VARHKRFELGRRDLHPAADDHVLGPVDVVQVLQLVAGDLEDVAGLEVAVLVERVGHAAGRQVAGEHAGPIGAQFAGDAGCGDLRAGDRVHDSRQCPAGHRDRPGPGAVAGKVERPHRATTAPSVNASKVAISPIQISP
jgi:hypothetical protein